MIWLASARDNPSMISPSSRRAASSLSRSGATGMALPPSVTLFGFGGDLVVGDDRYVLPLQAEAKANQRDDQVAERNRRRIADAEGGAVDEPEKRQHRAGAGIDRLAIEPAIDDE